MELKKKYEIIDGSILVFDKEDSLYSPLSLYSLLERDPNYTIIGDRRAYYKKYYFHNVLIESVDASILENYNSQLKKTLTITNKRIIKRNEIKLNHI